MKSFFLKNNQFALKFTDIYLIITFLVYGFYSSGTSINLFNKFVYILLPLLCLIIFIKKKEDIISDENFNFILFTADKKKWIILILLFSTLFYISSDRILLSISGDEYAYSSIGISHSILIIEKLLIKFEFLNHLSVSFVIRIISLAICLSVSLFFIFFFNYTKKNYYFKIILIFFLILLLRLLAVNFGGNNFPHPPLLGVPPLILTALFGLSDLTLKLSYFFAYFLLAYYFFNKINKKINIFLSLIITLGLFSSPGLIYLGSTVEQSLWTIICFTIIQIEILNNEKPNYNKLILIIILFSFFRILSLLSICLLFLNILVYSKNLKDFLLKIYDLAKSATPILILLPLIIFNFVDHSSLTMQRAGLNIHNFQELSTLLPSKILNSFQLPATIAIFTFFLISFFINKKTIILNAFLIILIVVYAEVIYSSNNPKYLYEIFFPFILSFSSFLLLKIDNKFLKTFFLYTSIFLIFFNTNLLKQFDTKCLELDEIIKNRHVYETSKKCNIIDAHPISLKNSYTFIKTYEKFSFKNLYVPGVYYGILPSIINNLKIEDYMSHKEINKRQNNLNLKNDINWISANARLINGDNDIKFVLLADLDKKDKIKKDLILLNWKIIFEEKNSFFKTKVFVLKKND